MYRAESRPVHSTEVSTRVPETVLRERDSKTLGVASLVCGEHMGDDVCGRDCCF